MKWHKFGKKIFGLLDFNINNPFTVVLLPLLHFSKIAVKNKHACEADKSRNICKTAKSYAGFTVIERLYRVGNHKQYLDDESWPGLERSKRE